MFDQNPKIVSLHLFLAPTGGASLQPSINTKRQFLTDDVQAGWRRNIGRSKKTSELVPACISQVRQAAAAGEVVGNFPRLELQQSHKKVSGSV